jgi:hypothetical protein
MGEGGSFFGFPSSSSSSSSSFSSSDGDDAEAGKEVRCCDSSDARQAQGVPSLGRREVPAQGRRRYHLYRR